MRGRFPVQVASWLALRVSIKREHLAPQRGWWAERRRQEVRGGAGWGWKGPAELWPHLPSSCCRPSPFRPRLDWPGAVSSRRKGVSTALDSRGCFQDRSMQISGRSGRPNYCPNPLPFQVGEETPPPAPVSPKSKRRLGRSLESQEGGKGDCRGIRRGRHAPPPYPSGKPAPRSRPGDNPTPAPPRRQTRSPTEKRSEAGSLFPGSLSRAFRKILAAQPLGFSLARERSTAFPRCIVRDFDPSQTAGTSPKPLKYRQILPRRGMPAPPPGAIDQRGARVGVGEELRGPGPTRQNGFQSESKQELLGTWGITSFPQLPIHHFFPAVILSHTHTHKDDPCKRYLRLASSEIV